MNEKNRILTDSEKIEAILGILQKMETLLDEFLEDAAKDDVIPDDIETKPSPPLPPAEKDKYDGLPWWPGKKGSQNIQVVILRTLADPIGNELLKKWDERQFEKVLFENDAYVYTPWRKDTGEAMISRFKKKAN
jgi:hypothetical protein